MHRTECAEGFRGRVEMRALALRMSSEAACGADGKVKLPRVCASFLTDV